MQPQILFSVVVCSFSVGDFIFVVFVQLACVPFLAIERKVRKKYHTYPQRPQPKTKTHHSPVVGSGVFARYLFVISQRCFRSASLLYLVVYTMQFTRNVNGALSMACAVPSRYVAVLGKIKIENVRVLVFGWVKNRDLPSSRD